MGGGKGERTGFKEVYCPFCGKWVLDTDIFDGRIITRCRPCGIKLVIVFQGTELQIYKGVRKKV